MAFRFIPEGAELKSVVWTVPTWSGYGPTFATEQEALEFASERQGRVPPGGNMTVVIDLRWNMTWAPPEGGGSSGIDFVAERFIYNTRLDLLEALLRHHKFSRKG